MMQERHNGGIVVVSVSIVRIDAAVAPAFRAALGRLVDLGHDRMVLDLSSVTFIDSTALGAIVWALKLAGRSGSIAIAGAGEAVATVFKLTRMDRVFRMFSSEAEAVAAMA